MTFRNFYNNLTNPDTEGAHVKLGWKIEEVAVESNKTYWLEVGTNKYMWIIEVNYGACESVKTFHKPRKVSSLFLQYFTV